MSIVIYDMIQVKLMNILPLIKNCETIIILWTGFAANNNNNDKNIYKAHSVNMKR